MSFEPIIKTNLIKIRFTKSNMLKTKIKKRSVSRIIPLLSIIALPLVFATGMALWFQVARAALPDITLRHGAVASSSTVTYAPATPAPVTFNSSGACPRWTGTINNTNMAATPITSGITASKLEAGSIVTFAVTLQNNSATNEAFDIMLNHDIPSGFELPGAGAQGANLCVHNGAGTSLAYTANGSGFFGNDVSDNIELTDSASGALSTASPSSGANIAVITFDLRVAANYTPGSTKTTTAELLGYSDADNGDPLAGGTASSSVKTRSVEHEKVLLSTNQPSTSGNFVVVGEQVTYELTVAVPEGEVGNVRITDGMPDGLAFISCDSIVNDNPGDIVTDLAGGISAACNDPTNPTVTNNGKDVTFTLGNLTNSDRTQPADETITIVYTAVVNNVAQATNGASLNNAARVYWTGDNTASESAPVIVHEPKVTADTVVTPNTGIVSGTRVKVMTTIKHLQASTANAYRMTVDGTVPAGLQFVPGSLVCANGVNPAATCSMTNNQLSATFASLLIADTATVTYEAVVESSIAGKGTPISLSAGWTSLPNLVSAPQSSYSATSVARTGSISSPGGASNNYLVTATATIGVGGSVSASTPEYGELAKTGADWVIILGIASGTILLAVYVTRAARRQ